MTYVPGADAAFAQNIPPGQQVAFGYYGGPNAYHVWPESDWRMFPGAKVPIWVGGYDGEGEAATALAALRRLGVPQGSVTVLDLETRVDKTYVNNFYAPLSDAGYLLWVYGSASTIYQNPQCNGYWVADYTSSPLPVIQQVGVRAVQYAPDLPPGYDANLVKQWTLTQMWGGS